MMPLLEILGFGLAILGHGFLWVALVNRLHAIGWSRLWTKAISLVCYTFFWGLLAAATWTVARDGQIAGTPLSDALPINSPGGVYFGLCVFAGVGIFAHWLWRKLTDRPAPAVLGNQTEVLDVAALCGRSLVHGFRGKAYSLVPGNQVVQLHIHEMQLAVARLPTALQGLSIAHLSDLHMTGQVDQAYFRTLVERTLALNADLIVIAGDLFDNAKCLEWIPDTLGRLTARLGVYFVLGNHDLRLHDTPRIRRELTAAGLIDLGGKTHERAIGAARLLLAGNEMPWIRPAPDLSNWPDRQIEPRQFRLLVSHSPDQIHWARRRDFDLLLAGHTHGGQVRVPLIGPIVAPSRYGIRFASGTFDLPPTLMHVSRGCSGKFMLRFNCPCELSKLTLLSAR